MQRKSNGGRKNRAVTSCRIHKVPPLFLNGFLCYFIIQGSLRLGNRNRENFHQPAKFFFLLLEILHFGILKVNNWADSMDRFPILVEI